MANFLRAWREYRGFESQSMLADALKEATGRQTDKTVISKLERGSRKLTYEWRALFAVPLRCAPDDLLAPPPTLDSNLSPCSTGATYDSGMESTLHLFTMGPGANEGEANEAYAHPEGETQEMKTVLLGEIHQLLSVMPNDAIRDVHSYLVVRAAAKGRASTSRP